MGATITAIATALALFLAYDARHDDARYKQCRRNDNQDFIPLHFYHRPWDVTSPI